MTIEQRTIAELYDHIHELKREIKDRKRQVRALKEFIEANRPPTDPVMVEWAKILKPHDTPFLDLVGMAEVEGATHTWGSSFLPDDRKDDDT